MSYTNSKGEMLGKIGIKEMTEDKKIFVGAGVLWVVLTVLNYVSVSNNDSCYTDWDGHVNTTICED